MRLITPPFMLKCISMVSELRDTEQLSASKIVTSIARINNPSVELLMKIFRLSPLAIQENSKIEDTFMGATGSEETNFLLASPIPPLAKLPEKMSDVPVWKVGDPDPKGNSFLLSIPLGEQKNLLPSAVELLERVMAVGTVPLPRRDFGVRKICTAEELRTVGLEVKKGRYLYLSRNLNLTAEQDVKIYASLYADLVNPEPVSRMIR